MGDAEHPVVATLYDVVMALPERYVLGDHREFLAAGASGRVLDIGTGTGAQLPQFATQAADVTALHAVEPDSTMRSRARDRAGEIDLPVRISGARVVASLVFCTIQDPEAALDEVARVLSPGGEFRFLEHVRASGAVGRVHDLAAPCWHAVAGGCTLNRRTGERFQHDDRFELLEYDRFDSGVTGVVPLVRGRMRRRSGQSLSLGLVS